ncbi:sterol O-acyltransferase 1-like [Oscarella lobularis]|uniref:sterol O-acyltransferase 1-like n=1 Tax=Oscarella lobularis TaxID=121494 RepID=UPI0033134000
MNEARKRGTSESGRSTENGTSHPAKSFRQHAAEMRAELVETIDSRLEQWIEDACRSMKNGQDERRQTIDEESIDGGGDPRGKAPHKRLPYKVFCPRDSLLTTMLKTEHIQTIYNIFVVVLIVMGFNTFVYDVLEQGRLVFDFSHIFWAFGDFSTVITLWMAMQAQALVIYPLFQFWIQTRRQANASGAVDVASFIVYTSYLLLFFYYPISMLATLDLPPASSIVVACEQMRFIMKVHSFIRENAAKVLYPSAELAPGLNKEIPGFSRYLYFLFCPTLIYRDVYPRTPEIRWSYVATNFAQVAACLVYTYYMFYRFLIPVLQNTGKAPWNLRSLAMAVFSCILPGTMVLLLGFFSLLHSWLNAFAEMTQFADRQFYKDWWNSRQWGTYYRTWNVVVHDWLHSYVFRDMEKFFSYNSRCSSIPRFAVFVLSAVVHEYVLVCAFRFFFPVLFVMFGGFGLGFIYLTNHRQSRLWNIFMWLMLFTGCGLLMCLYSHEWFVRKNCPMPNATWADYIVPRTLTCNYGE